MTDPNALAKQAWEDAERAGEDAYIEAVQTGVASSDIAMAKGAVAAQAAIAAVYAPRLAELEAEVERLQKQVVELCVAKQHLERAVIKAASPDFMTLAEQEALADFVEFLRSTEGKPARTALGASHDA